jgi:microsomal dipeptidase-like Zn-dependent dipeptidase
MRALLMWTVMFAACGHDRPKVPAWGYADLHVHPAIQFAFGADDDGENGIIWGSFGGDADADTLADDLPPCDGDKHGDSLDPVNDGAKWAAFSGLDGSTGGNHLFGGAPSFNGWPDPQTVTHQELHASMVKRAWEGGLRVMVASATDNELLSKMWTITDWTSILAQIDQGDTAAQRSFEVASAERQLDAIHDWVSANSSWMTIVRDSTDLQRALDDGKLAVVLAVEMDSLDADDILTLHDEEDVSLATPIHLVNNPGIGGTAVYSDLFNAANQALRGGGDVAVEDDGSVRWRYANPRHLETAIDDLVFLGLPGLPFAAMSSVSDGASCRDGYELCSANATPVQAGEVNADGLYEGGEEQLTELMKAGIILDLAHMSDKSQSAVLDMATEFGMPVVDSHTDLRPVLADVGTAARQVTERTLSLEHLDMIGAVGGMVGLGTEGKGGPHLVERVSASPVTKLVSSGGSWTWTLHQPELILGVVTGADDLGSGSTLEADITDGKGNVIKQNVLEQGDDGPVEVGTLGSGERDWLTVPLPVGMTAGDIHDLTLRFESDCGLGCDNWQLESLEVFYVVRDDAKLLFSGTSDPYLHYFRANKDDVGSPEWTVPVSIQPKQVVLVETWTGDDDLRCGAGAQLTLVNGDGSSWSDPIFDRHLEPYRGFPSHSVSIRPVALDEGVSPEDVRSVGMTLLQGSCDVGSTSDNWNLDGLRVIAPRSTPLVMVERFGWPIIRLSESDPEVALPAEPLYDSSSAIGTGPAKSRFYKVSIQTGTDDLQDSAIATAGLGWGGSTPGVIAFPLNEGAKWSDGYQAWSIVDLGEEVDANDLSWLMITVVNRKDEWKIQSVQIDRMDGPIGELMDEIGVALPHLGNRGVALGTDMNGLAPQIPYSEVPITYPLALTNAPTTYVPLDQQQLGDRVFDFPIDGLSNYGALPDLMAALEARDPTPDDTAPVFKSADDFLQMWKSVESAAASMP